MYSDKEVGEGLVNDLIKAAMLAPSAGNQQPWHFIVIRDRQKLDAIPSYHPYCKMVVQVGVAILVCGDPDGKKWPEFWVQDCSAATQNLLLAARGMGLGTVWTGVFPDKERMAGFRREFNVPEHIFPFALVPVGWPKHENSFKPAERFQPELVHRERFGQ
jgi:nitroreductase